MIVERYRDYPIEQDARGLYIRDWDNGMKRRRCDSIDHAKRLIDAYRNREEGKPYEWPLSDWELMLAKLPKGEVTA